MNCLRSRLWTHRWRIVLTMLAGAMLVAAYRYRVLPQSADVLLDCFLYLSVATTFTPLPSPPPIVYAATQAPVMLVAAVAAAGTTVAYLLEYAVLGPMFAHRSLTRMQDNRAFLWLARTFERLPFVALSLAAFLPLPVDGVRIMAIARRYDRRRYALAAFLGRLPRYALLAGFGYTLRFLGPPDAAGATPPASPPAAAKSKATATASATSAGNPRLEDLLGRLDRGADRLVDARARFRQERWSPAFDEPERSRGELWYRRPHDIVLRYSKPDEQMVYIDSLGFWLHLVKEKQAQRYPFASAAERDAALAVLWQPSRVLKSLYRLAPSPAAPAGERKGEWLELVPLDNDLRQVVARVHVRLGTKLGLSDCVIVEQHNGERVRLEVEDIERNPGISPARFRFDPPRGVEVVRF